MTKFVKLNWILILLYCTTLVKPILLPKNTQSDQLNRRSLLGETLSFIGAIVVLPGSANAVKERNEALCSTGFFTNIAQWYCTDIGDISDEGVGKSLSNGQENSLDSLMTKFEMTEVQGSTDVETGTENEMNIEVR